MSRKLILYIATSVDGYIAKSNDDLSFLNSVQKEGEDYGYNQFIESVDTVIMGRKTYDWVMNAIGSSPHSDKATYVITHREKPSEGTTIYYTGDLKELVDKLKSENGKNIYCDGGAQVVNELLKLELIDEIIISLVPVLLGEGIKLFNGGIPEQNLELVNVRKFETGLIQFHYKRKSTNGY